MSLIRKENKDNIESINIFKVVGIALLIIIPLFIIADFKIYSKKKQLAAQIEAYKQKIEDIKKSNQTLQEEIANSDNKDYLEKIAYEQLGQQKPGEKQIIFIEPENNQAIVGQNDSADKKSWLGWLSGAWGWIKSKF